MSEPILVPDDVPEDDPSDDVPEDDPSDDVHVVFTVNSDEEVTEDPNSLPPHFFVGPPGRLKTLYQRLNHSYQAIVDLKIKIAQGPSAKKEPQFRWQTNASKQTLFIPIECCIDDSVSGWDFEGCKDPKELMEIEVKAASRLLAEIDAIGGAVYLFLLICNTVY